MSEGGFSKEVYMSTQLDKAEQNKKIAAEKRRLLALFKDISSDKKGLATSLIDRVAFMKITLDLLEDDIKEKGATYLFENGKQTMIIESPSQKSYNTMINRYTSAIKQLNDLLPKNDSQILDDGFENFINKDLE